MSCITVGSFYANFAVRGPDQTEITTTLRRAGRQALVTPTVNNITVVYDCKADDLDDIEIDEVGTILSSELHCPVLAAAVADDDELWLGLYEAGKRTVEYSSRGRWGGSSHICQAFGRTLATPAVWLLLQLPYVVFESMRHAA